MPAPDSPEDSSPQEVPLSALGQLWKDKHSAIAAVAIGMILLHLLLRFAVKAPARVYDVPLLFTLGLGGIPIVLELLKRLWKREFGSDLLAGISIITSVLLHEYLAGAIIVLMLSGGEALESFAVQNASSVLRALAKRMPQVAHKRAGAQVTDVPLEEVCVGDVLEVFPHDICPVDGVVVEGHGTMDESYLTGEPFLISKTPGAEVLSGAVNGDSALVIRAGKLAVDSRYAKIMQVMRASQQYRPRIRRMGDRLGAFYTPLALAVGGLAWALSGDPDRFLSVMVIATPCPLLIAIPVAIIASISLAAKRGMIVKNPVVLEQIDQCRTMIFDKTGTLTYGEPQLVEQFCAEGVDPKRVLLLAASVERYSRHPLSAAVREAARQEQIELETASKIREAPGEGLVGVVDGKTLCITSRRKFLASHPGREELLPPPSGGLECVILVDGAYAATYRFRDTPRIEGGAFVKHLGPRHKIYRIMVVSGDRESEVRYLAEKVGIPETYAAQSPEDKLAIVRRETARANTIFIGDGINDAPALMAATVGIAIGQNSDVTSEAAGVVIMESSLGKVDELFHLGRRMRFIALQSALGGMGLSLLGMGFASVGLLSPIAGAITQEVIDALAVLNALRAAFHPRSLSDF